jgi:phage baseplate assembly protein V
MMTDLLYRVAELERMVRNIVRKGVIVEADYPAARIRVQSGGIVTGWIPWLTTRAQGERSWWAPRVGEQVVLFSPGGDPAQALALPAIYHDGASAPQADPDVHYIEYPDGAFWMHDMRGGQSKTTFYTPGDVDSRADGVMRLSADELERHGDTRMEKDVAGRGEAVNHLGGSSFSTDSYVEGSEVTGSTEHGFSPPEVD